MSSPLLQLVGITKSFGELRALKPLHLALQPAETLGLVGENGAGKSTLIKILSGVYTPDAGEIFWQGQRVEFASPRAALETGIATIHQELACFSHLTVAENLLMGESWPRYRWGGVNRGALHAQAGQILKRFGIPISPEAHFREISAAQRQEIAIARALSEESKLIILDEPTASLSEREVDQWMGKLAWLRDSGVAIIYVSHRLEEIRSLTQRVAVLRDGELVATYPTSEASIQHLVQDMVGRPLDQVYPHQRGRSSGAVLLEVEKATCRGLFEDVTLSLRAGEITGLAGLVGSGRSELARAIFGLYPLDRGSMRLHGRPWAPAQPRDSIAAGVIYVPEERKRQGFVLDHSFRDSVSIGFTDLLTAWGIIPRAAEARRISAIVDKYGVRVADVTQPIGNLSGGNQQKGLLARWLERDPQVLILDEPTRGVDVGAKADLHALIDRLAGAGKAVLLISSELPEVLAMSDRVLVMHRGRIAAELEGPSKTQERVILAASGLCSDGPLAGPRTEMNHP